MDLSFLMVFLKDAPGQTPKLILTLCRRVILIEKSFACSQVVTIASLVSELFLFLLYDLSFPCGYFFWITMEISIGKWQKIVFRQ